MLNPAKRLVKHSSTANGELSRMFTATSSVDESFMVKIVGQRWADGGWSVDVMSSEPVEQQIG
jgi:hypothetical protein